MPFRVMYICDLQRYTAVHSIGNREHSYVLPETNVQLRCRVFTRVTKNETFLSLRMRASARRSTRILHAPFKNHA